ncbi:mechanosensitive ion channel family protein [Virgibacillus litoralis]|uniref:MscS family membrane protein n=1 Tax=Virgibacillus litoralis TaxID=578221 RepID=A0ABS4HH81_9BACI|nr:mechanosensitive ion channel family protein [Virgibacillus litoralis]MBP1950198.1 MscS family membrane protein [Virgibacillus litoralis]
MTWSWELFFSYEAVKDIGISIGIILLFLIFRKIFAKYIFKLLLRLSKKAPNDFFSYIFIAFEKPVRWLFIIIGVYVAVDYFPYLEQANPLFQNIIRSFVIFMISWGLYNLSASSSLFFTNIEERLDIDIDDILIPFLSKALRFIIVAISISVIAQEFGYNVSGFVAGLGLGGLAFALAAKDAISNLFGGIVIITEKPFTIGHWIKTESVEGVVEDITFRSTLVRTFADALVTVPNATLANESITNWSQMNKRQIMFYLRVTYDNPREKIETVVNQIEDLLKNHAEIHQETIFVSLDQYKEYGLDILLYFFTKTTDWGDYLNIREELNFKILEILENEGVTIAIPSRRLYMDSENDKQSPVRQESE